MLYEVARLQNDPSLEKVAVEYLKSPNATRVVDAAQYLEEYGSASSEDALWARFEDWASAYAARDRRKGPRDAEANPMEQFYLGGQLGRALVYGPGWLTDQRQARPH